MAMHIHTSFSEQSGSMAGHLDAAQTHGVDVVWWTDHDFRMSGRGYRQTVHFTSLTDEAPDADEGKPWVWRRVTTGALSTASEGGIVAQPTSPKDPVPQGSLHVVAESTGQADASLGFFANATAAGWTYHGNLTGQTLSFEVQPVRVGVDSYLEFLVATSFMPASGARPAGTYSISYRFGGVDPPGTRRQAGLLGIVSVPFTPQQWNSIDLHPTEDIAALWPELAARDFASFGFTLSAVSRNGRRAAGHFDYLRMTRENSGDIPLQTQTELTAEYASQYKNVTQRQGLELSWQSPHLNWFGGKITLPDYTALLATVPAGRLLKDALVPLVHKQGGLVSYNHPYGTSGGEPLPVQMQDQRQRDVATSMLTNKALGVDIIEVGYPLRSQVDLAHHGALWDACSRNAIFLTGNGVTDDHYSTMWTGVDNDWVTSAWAPDRSEGALLQAMRSGRAWCASLSRYRGMLDLRVDGSVPMGAVSLSRATSRSVSLTATDLPVGSKLRLIRGNVDYAGLNDPAPNSRPVADLGPTAFKGGRAVVAVDTAVSCFIRSEVVDRFGHVIAMSNPVWLLRDPPPAAVPAARSA